MILFRGQALPARYSAARGRRGLTPILPDAYISPATGRMAEWLCNGLQIRVQRFDSASGLQFRLKHSPVAGLDPATHVFLEVSFGKDVDARDKPGQGAFLMLSVAKTRAGS